MALQMMARPELSPPFQSDAVAAAFASFPDPYQGILLDVRRLIFAIAGADPEIGDLAETLKWGQPAYLTNGSRSGTTIRLGRAKTGAAAIYTHCQTSVISDFRALFPDTFTYEGNRAVYLDPASPLPEEALNALIRSALRYHLSPRSNVEP
ncbi:DUF1801 domain-containing protein [Aestuariibius sp. 2305UL40-4]|uniref:DUF1801 domain-containing protein n=1 Tax=Aestuariibius violaceus TaxID=3234132 RepID=UPI00345E85D4